MTTLLVGFDSAWTPGKRGAITAALRKDDGSYQALGAPRLVNFTEAESAIVEWQMQLLPVSTLIFLDQPTIVPNASGQRPVENVVSASVSRRRGGMQPASTNRAEMFGTDAPVWPFLTKFGGAADPLSVGTGSTLVFETYPVLALIALGWLREDSRPAGRLPKYNPERAKTFSIDDWRHVCDMTASALEALGLSENAQWVSELGSTESPKKADQDKLDACLCLLVAAYAGEKRPCLMVGDISSGYIVVPHCANLKAELDARCVATNKDPASWVRELGR